MVFEIVLQGDVWIEMGVGGIWMLCGDCDVMFEFQ